MSFKYSQFFYDFIIDSTNNYIDFVEGGVTKYAILKNGSYTLTGFCKEISRALNAISSLTYSCEADRATRIITISSSDTFSLLFSSGANSESSIRNIAGFGENDYLSSTSFEGVSAVGKIYSPQAPISAYTSFEDWEGVSNASVSSSISGRKKIVSYGVESFMEMNIYPITDLETGNSVLRTNNNAVSEVREFLRFITKGNPIEFMFDVNTPGVFSECYIESTKDSKEGLSFKLYKYKNIFNVFETGNLKFRKKI